MIHLLPPPERLLGRHVAGRAEPDAEHRLGLRRAALGGQRALERAVDIADDLRQAPVGHVDFAVAPEQDVARLEVPVDDVARVRVADGAAHLDEHSEQAHERPVAPQRRVVDHVPERGGAHDPHRVEEVLASERAEVMDRDDARMLELARDLRLADEAPAVVLTRANLLLQHLECDRAAHPPIHRREDDAHAALAELRADLVARLVVLGGERDRLLVDERDRPAARRIGARDRIRRHVGRLERRRAVVLASGDRDGRRERRPREDLGQAGARELGLDGGTQQDVVGARRGKERGPRVRLELERFGGELLHLVAAARVHGPIVSFSARKSSRMRVARRHGLRRARTSLTRVGTSAMTPRSANDAATSPLSRRA